MIVSCDDLPLVRKPWLKITDPVEFSCVLVSFFGSSRVGPEIFEDLNPIQFLRLHENVESSLVGVAGYSEHSSIMDNCFSEVGGV